MSIQVPTKGQLRRTRFLAVATKLFLQHGFAAVSVNEIVRQAGGSLATLYANFPTKEDLLIAIAMGDSVCPVLTRLQPCYDDLCVRESLILAGHEFLDRNVQPMALGMYRIMISAMPEFSEEARAFMLCRKTALSDEVGAFLSRQCLRGTLKIEDAAFAATQFVGLIRGACYLELLCGADEFREPAYLARIVTEGVDTFIARYGDRAAPVKGHSTSCPCRHGATDCLPCGNRTETAKPPSYQNERCSQQVCYSPAIDFATLYLQHRHSA